MAFSLETFIDAFIVKGASDIYLSTGAPPALRLDDKIEFYGKENLTQADIDQALHQLFDKDVLEEFNSTLELNTALNWKDKVRFRINLLRQRQSTGVVMRRIHTEIPTLESLNLPKTYAELIMEKRGLILVVGPTGSGKSTSLAAMLNHRNLHGSGHIVTIEDPIEFVLPHHNCIITQRDIGVDTYSFNIGLKNALRQTPDVIVIGEIRDKDTMEHAIVFAETGHLCLATLHANNANQAIERVLNFFPEEKHSQILLNLSLNLKAILSQRLLPSTKGGRIIALEIMLNRGLISSLILEGRIKEIKEYLEKGRGEGMQSFDQAMFDLYLKDLINEETALAQAENPANLRLAFTQHHMEKRLGPFHGKTSPVMSSKPNF